MVHILRNALDHGLESIEERRQKMKAENGTIHIKALVISGFLQFTIFDDGRGLAIEKLRKMGQQSGELQADPSLEDIAELIFHSGISTSTSVGNISGRGVGMCAVRQFAKEAGGSCEIKLGSEKNEPGFYEFELVLRIPQQQYQMVGAA
ncbi:ATP-binding protein [Oligoflexus sp.]|uniref:ATP-binding protein n=1 Tax=Oligoflexus sp. TaxID=1971216 RepID=UPI002D77C4C0|nr:ATP-binding protein [Oligoflexus sp.]